MNKKQFALAMTYLGIVFNKNFTSDTVSVWYEYFHIIEEETFKRAIKQLALKTKYLPSMKEVADECIEIQKSNNFGVLDQMYKDGYFRSSNYGKIEAQQELRNYDKAVMWLTKNTLPKWLIEDMMKYGYRPEIDVINTPQLKSQALQIKE